MHACLLADVAATEACGARLASALEGQSAVISLAGPLGAGKTTLVRGLLRALGHEGTVRSPTYTLVEPYDLAGLHVLHVDLYRIADGAELEFLGLREQTGTGTVLLVEWPEHGTGHLPAADLGIAIDYHGEGRCIRAAASGDQGCRLLAALFPSD